VVVRDVEGVLPLRVSFVVTFCVNVIICKPCPNNYPLIVVIGHVQTIGVKRPGFGTSGKPIQVTVNAFEATVTDGIIYHYDG
jgi:hypothetical protein